MSSLLALRTPALSHVRIGLIGLGQRGKRLLERYRFIEGATITSVADSDADAVADSLDLLARQGRKAEGVVTADEWQSFCQREDIDVVYICTPWELHAEMAIVAMESGKHAVVEVPAALTVEDCWRLIETARRTQRHLYMAENCCYDGFALGTLAAVQRGDFGLITHCEGAYLHDLREQFGIIHHPAGALRQWMGISFARHGANPYPTHGIGPIAWLLAFHRGNRMTQLSSVSSRCADEETAAGRVNTTLIQTANGATALLQLDLTTPRPYSRLQTVCGTEGFAQKYPLPTFSSRATEGVLTAEDAIAAAFSAAERQPAFEIWKRAHDEGIDNEMNFTMDSRLIYCLRHGLPLDIDAYDTVEWSCLTALTRESALRGGTLVEVPDFTEGHWQELQGHRFYI